MSGQCLISGCYFEHCMIHTGIYHQDLHQSVMVACHQRTAGVIMVAVTQVSDVMTVNGVVTVIVVVMMMMIVVMVMPVVMMTDVTLPEEHCVTLIH